MRTSPTGKTARFGFTLLEMLVVLAIIGVLLALALPHYAQLSPRLRMLAASRQLLIDLRRARVEASTGQRTVAVSFYPARQAYVIDNLEDRLDVAFDVASNGVQASSDSVPVFYFYTDGSATPGRIALADSGFGVNVHVDGLTGQMSADGK